MGRQPPCSLQPHSRHTAVHRPSACSLQPVHDICRWAVRWLGCIADKVSDQIWIRLAYLSERLGFRFRAAWRLFSRSAQAMWELGHSPHILHWFASNRNFFKKTGCCQHNTFCTHAPNSRPLSVCKDWGRIGTADTALTSSSPPLGDRAHSCSRVPTNLGTQSGRNRRPECPPCTQQAELHKGSGGDVAGSDFPPAVSAGSIWPGR